MTVYVGSDSPTITRAEDSIDIGDACRLSFVSALACSRLAVALLKLSESMNKRSMANENR